MFEEIRAIVAANLGVEEEGITVQTSFMDQAKLFRTLLLEEL